MWKVWLSPVQSDGRLDESLEGAYAWWRAEPERAKATADVLSVVPEDDLIVLRFLTGPPPTIGTELRIYPIQYLQKLRDLWSDTQFAEQCLDWWDRFARRNLKVAKWAADPSPFEWLRKSQREAFGLSAWTTSFLWGPPGTGKTTTLGALLASLLWKRRSTRILLLSTTNSAVDQAIVAVDRALAQITANEVQPSPLRKTCLRIGSHFLARYYEGREHLLPTKDFTLLQRLLDLHKQEPDKRDAGRYARWKAEVESVQNQMRRQAADALRRARLAAMTTTSAAFRYDDLRHLPPYDLVVFDEASQVSLVHALSLVHLGRRVLFAGDPRQLAPVVKSKHPEAEHWLGRSPFDRMPEAASCTCLLDEQSRMADQICKLVSHTFYDGKLKVAADKRNDRKWLSERQAFNIRGYGRRNVYLVKTNAEPKYSQRMGGWIRRETAEAMITFVGQLTERLEQDEILIITPYRAQRTLIRRKLRSAGYKHVHVSTVHRAQGSERDTVIFDPVSADNSFLNNNDLGPRLINVAVSRAKARLVLFASPENLRNPVIAQIAAIIENSGNLSRGESVEKFIWRADFPDCVIGKTICIPRKSKPDLVVQVKELDPSGTKLKGVNCTTGESTAISIEHLKRACGGQG